MLVMATSFLRRLRSVRRSLPFDLGFSIATSADNESCAREPPSDAPVPMHPEHTSSRSSPNHHAPSPHGVNERTQGAGSLVEVTAGRTIVQSGDAAVTAEGRGRRRLARRTHP